MIITSLEFKKSPGKLTGLIGADTQTAHQSDKAGLMIVPL
jgi:hypothetical protein